MALTKLLWPHGIPIWQALHFWPILHVGSPTNGIRLFQLHQTFAGKCTPEGRSANDEDKGVEVTLVETTRSTPDPDHYRLELEEFRDKIAPQYNSWEAGLP